MCCGKIYIPAVKATVNNQIVTPLLKQIKKTSKEMYCLMRKCIKCRILNLFPCQRSSSHPGVNGQTMFAITKRNYMYWHIVCTISPEGNDGLKFIKHVEGTSLMSRNTWPWSQFQGPKHMHTIISCRDCWILTELEEDSGLLRLWLPGPNFNWASFAFLRLVTANLKNMFLQK